MSTRPKRSLKPPANLKEYIVATEIDGEDDSRETTTHLDIKSKGISQEPFTYIKCKTCNAKCNTRIELIHHLKKHKGKENFLCEDCGKSLSSFQAFTEHKNIHKDHKPYKCEVCGHNSRQLSVHSRHMLTHEKNPSQLHKCAICSKTFKQKVYLKQHTRKHVGEKPYECNECSKSFSAKTELNRHMVSHSSTRAFACKHCNKKFKLKYNLNAHVKAHTGKQNWKCCLCNATFPQHCLLESHKKSHTEVIQHLELVKTDQQSLTITSLPLDRRKVLHHQKVSLPRQLDLNDSQNSFNAKVALGLNDALIPFSVIANSFGAGNYIKMKIVDQINAAKSLSQVRGVTNAVLVDEGSVLSEAVQEDQAPSSNSTELKLNNSAVEEVSCEEKRESAFRSHCGLFDKTFTDQTLDDAKLSWLQGFVDITKELDYPLEYSVSQKLCLVQSKLQDLFLHLSQRDDPKGPSLDLHAPSCESCYASSAEGRTCEEGASGHEPEDKVLAKTQSSQPPLDSEASQKEEEIQKSRVHLCHSEKVKHRWEERERLKQMHKCYVFLSKVLQKHFKVALGVT